MPRILPTLTPRDLWRERDDRRPVWWRDMARWSTLPVALCIVLSLTVWEPFARPGALILLWIVVCVGMGTEPRRDGDGPPQEVRPRGPRGGLSQRAPRTPVRRGVPRGPRTGGPSTAPRRRTRPRTPVGLA